MSLSLNIRDQARGWLSLFGSRGCVSFGRIADIPILVHWTWFVVALLEVTFRRNVYEHWLWNVAEYLTLFAIVLLHELGHAFACRSVGGRVDRIILWPLGGIVTLHPPPRPWPTMWTIAGGPLVNALLLPLLAWLTFSVAGVRLFRGVPTEDLPQFLLLMTIVNAILLVFNLLPFYPLDGGQLLHAFLWLIVGRARALLAVSVVGVLGAISLGLVLVQYRPWVTPTGMIWLGVSLLFLLVQAVAGLIAAIVLLRPGWEHLMAALQYLRQNQPDRAITECTIALTLLSDDPGARGMAHQRRGAAYLALGDVDQAVTELVQAATAAPHAIMFFCCGEALLMLGDHRKAIEYYDAAFPSPSFAEMARHLQARAWYGRGEARYRLGEVESAHADFKEARKIDHSIPQTFYGEEAGERKRHAWVIDACDVWLRTTMVRTPGGDAVNRAQVLINEHKFEDAVLACNEAIGLAPSLLPAYVNRSEALRQLGRLDESLADAEFVLKQEPTSPFGLTLRAAVRRLQGDHRAAVVDCDSALRVNPAFVPALFERLQAALAQEDFAAAEADCDAVLRLAPEATGGYLFRGMARAGQKRYAEAIADYEESIRRNANEPFPYNNLAYLLATCEDENIFDGPRALQLAQKACELSEGSIPTILETLATAHAATGDFAEAIRWEHKALEDVAFEKQFGDKVRRKITEFEQGRRWRE